MRKVENPFEIIYGEGFEADMASVKSKMLILLVKTLRDNFKSRIEMMQAIGCGASQISAIMNGKLGTLSFEKLAQYLYKMGFKPSCELDVQSEQYGYPFIKLEIK